MGARRRVVGAFAGVSLLALFIAPPPGGTEPPAPPDQAADAPGASLPSDRLPDALELAPLPDELEVQPGSVVHLEYTLRSVHGELLDSTRGRTPLVFTHGAGQIIPGLERALLGMKAGQRKRFSVPPEDAYGPVDPTAIVELPKDRVPSASRRVGASLAGRTRSGRAVEMRVVEIRDETVILDLNHPLAGETLVFEVTIILIEPP